MVALLEIGLHLGLAAVAGLVDQTQDVQGHGDPPVGGDRVAERRGTAAAGQHPDHVVRAHGPGADGADDPKDVLPVPFDPGEVDPAATFPPSPAARYVASRRYLWSTWDRRPYFRASAAPMTGV